MLAKEDVDSPEKIIFCNNQVSDKVAWIALITLLDSQTI